MHIIIINNPSAVSQKETFFISFLFYSIPFYYIFLLYIFFFSLRNTNHLHKRKIVQHTKINNLFPSFSTNNTFYCCCVGEVIKNT